MHVEWLRGLLGGALIGVGAALLLWTHGRVAGVSGIFAGALTSRRGDLGWRWAFMVALLLSGAALGRLWPERFSTLGTPHWPIWIGAGLLVGIGTRIGGGCTSGHGVCGVARGSPRSLLATLVFVASAIVTVLLTRHGP